MSLHFKRTNGREKQKLYNHVCKIYSFFFKGPRLFIPKVSVLPGLHQVNHHPVYIEIGHLTSHDFDECLEDSSSSCVSPSGLEVGVTVPLLAGSLADPPAYALALAKFYEKCRGDIPHRNLLYPCIPVDEIKMNEHEAVIRNGSDELRIAFNRFNHPCKPSTSIVKEEFDTYFLDNLQFGLPEPDYSFCDRHTCNSKFCSNTVSLRCDVHRFAPNVCQVFTSNDMTPCEASIEIKNITSGFRDFILLGDEPVDILASRSFSNNASVGLKYPCQD